MVSPRCQNHKIKALLCLLFCLSCNYQKSKETEAPIEIPVPKEEGPSEQQGPLISFSQVQEQVFFRHCQECHKRLGVFLFDDHQVVVDRMERIIQRVFVEQTMPQTGKLPEADRAFLKDWIEQGAPL